MEILYGVAITLIVETLALMIATKWLRGKTF